jgi:hypothetical protein
MGDRAAAAQHGRPLLHLPGSQQQVQQAPAAAAASPSKTDPAGLQRLTAALTAVLSSGMASDFVEGLKPVLHNGKLAISTYIKLAHDPEPVFIGMFASLPAAVTAQKQSAELVSNAATVQEALAGCHHSSLHCTLPTHHRHAGCLVDTGIQLHLQLTASMAHMQLASYRQRLLQLGRNVQMQPAHRGPLLYAVRLATVGPPVPGKALLTAAPPTSSCLTGRSPPS